MNALAGSTYPLRRLSRHTEARQRLDAAFERLRETKNYPADKVRPGSELEYTLCALGDYEADTGHIPRAIDIYWRNESRRYWRGGLNLKPSLSDAADMLAPVRCTCGDQRRASQSEPAFRDRKPAVWAFGVIGCEASGATSSSVINSMRRASAHEKIHAAVISWRIALIPRRGSHSPYCSAVSVWQVDILRSVREADCTGHHIEGIHSGIR